jgi:hypothetical protein
MYKKQAISKTQAPLPKKKEEVGTRNRETDPQKFSPTPGCVQTPESLPLQAAGTQGAFIQARVEVKSTKTPPNALRCNNERVSNAGKNQC